jgi:hypothetical protein
MLSKKKIETSARRKVKTLNSDLANSNEHNKKLAALVDELTQVVDKLKVELKDMSEKLGTLHSTISPSLSAFDEVSAGVEWNKIESLDSQAKKHNSEMDALKTSYEGRLRLVTEQRDKHSAALSYANSALETEKANSEQLERKVATMERQLATWKENSAQLAAEERRKVALAGRNIISIFIALVAMIVALFAWNVFMFQSDFGGTPPASSQAALFLVLTVNQPS